MLAIANQPLRDGYECLKILQTDKKYSSFGGNEDILFQLEACLSVQGPQMISSIEEMHIGGRDEMTYIFKGPVQSVSLQNLKVLSVGYCRRVKTIFSVCILRSLPQLEELKITRCGQLEQILEDYDDDKVILNENSQQVCFPKLKTVEVRSCDKLRHLFSVCILRSLPQLEHLKITFCEELERILEDHDVDKVISNESTQQVVFPNLKTVEVLDYNKLRHLFSISTSLELPQLWYLSIENTARLEEVFESTCLKEEVVEFPSMEYLELIKFPSFTKVCQGFKLQSDYCQVYVRECPKHNSSSSVANPEVTGICID